jgi:hypothetical protein
MLHAQLLPLLSCAVGLTANTLSELQCSVRAPPLTWHLAGLRVKKLTIIFLLFMICTLILSLVLSCSCIVGYNFVFHWTTLVLPGKCESENRRKVCTLVRSSSDLAPPHSHCWTLFARLHQGSLLHQSWRSWHRGA